MRFHLPLPPSTNHLYHRSRGGRTYRTKEYKGWIAQSLLELKNDPIVKGVMNQKIKDLVDSSKKPPYSDPDFYYVVKLKAYMPKKRDLDNIIKPILDVLQKAHLIYDDNLVRFIEATKYVVSTEPLEHLVVVDLDQLIGHVHVNWRQAPPGFEE